jgi:hypothetical protein
MMEWRATAAHLQRFVGRYRQIFIAALFCTSHAIMSFLTTGDQEPEVIVLIHG